MSKKTQKQTDARPPALNIKSKVRAAMSKLQHNERLLKKNPFDSKRR